MEAAGEAIDDQLETENYLKRLESGLGIVQLVDYITAEVIVGCGGEVSIGGSSLLAFSLSFCFLSPHL